MKSQQAINYNKSIFGILSAAKGNLPESQFDEIVKSLLTDIEQLNGKSAPTIYPSEEEIEKAAKEFMKTCEGFPNARDHWKAAIQWLQTSAGTREGELEKCLGEIANLNPYPEDVFLPVSDELLKDIHKLLMKTYSIPIDRLSGHIGRLLLNGIQAKAKKLLSKSI